MTETSVETRSIGERMREVFQLVGESATITQGTMRLSFGKCPKCGERLVRGNWLRWCPDRTCGGYTGVLNKELGKKIEVLRPVSSEETEALHRLAESLGVEVS